MKKRLILLIILLLGCENNEVPEEEELLEEIPKEEIPEEIAEIAEEIEEPAEETEINELPIAESEKETVTETIIETPEDSKNADSAPIDLPKLVKGKTVEQRLEEAYDNLHDVGSADHIRESFPDIELVFSDNPTDYPKEILPFDYYYSEEADKTFNLCGVDRTVFICDGKLDHAVTDEELNDNCVVTSEYLEK